MDADRKDVTWVHLYRYIYTENNWSFWGLLNFEVSELKGKNQAFFKDDIQWTEKNKEFKEFVEKYHDIFSMSGDADFDLKDMGFEKYIENPICQMHMFKNFSLMPCVGGMNNAKGKKRFHIFLSILNDYYKNPDISNRNIEPLFRSVGRPFKNKRKQKEMIERRKNALKGYLNLFSDIADYCQKIHLIDGINSERVDELIQEADDTESYCNFAKEYWQSRETVMRKRIPKDEQEWLAKDINDV